jgi:hypothetical protein
VLLSYLLSSPRPAADRQSQRQGDAFSVSKAKKPVFQEPQQTMGRQLRQLSKHDL